MRSSARQRQDAILTELYQNRRVTASSLAKMLSVSEATVRRDMRSLADSGKLVLNYGGAALPGESDFSYHSKAMRNVQAKRTIGQLAGQFISDGEQIFVDSGTTCFGITGPLKRKRGVSVIVNSARLALELDTPNLSVILLGGQYRPDRMDTVGPLTSAAMDQLRGYTAFIGADGLSMEFGLTASDVESAFIFRLAVTNASRTILLADHTKFQTSSLCKIVNWDAISRVVTDQPPSRQWAEFLAERNIDVVAPTPQTQDEQQNSNKP